MNSAIVVVLLLIVCFLILGVDGFSSCAQK